jgi:hypothetical protein
MFRKGRGSTLGAQRVSREPVAQNQIKIDELDMCGTIEHEMIGFDMTCGRFVSIEPQTVGVTRCTDVHGLASGHSGYATTLNVLNTCGTHRCRSTSSIRSSGVDSRTSQSAHPLPSP